MKKLLVATDFRESNSQVCAKAIAFAKHLQAEVSLVHAIEYIPYYPYYPYNEKKFRQDCYNEINERMNEQKDIFEAAGITVNENIIEDGNAYDVICNAATKIHACAIIVGVGEHFLLENLIGSTAEKVARLAKQNVIVINPHNQGDIHKILCAYDFTAHADSTLEKAINVANIFGADLDIIHVVHESAYRGFYKVNDAPLEEIKEKLLKATETLRDNAKVTVNCHVKTGKPAVEICNFAKHENTQLLVMGASGHNTLTRLFLGSNTNHVLRKAPCSILITRLT